MSKTLMASANLTLGLVRDAFGNGLVGDATRSMRYLELAGQAMELHIEMMTDRNSPALERKLREFHADACNVIDSWPPLDMSRAEESMRAFAKAGVNSILPTVDPNELADGGWLGDDGPRGGGETGKRFFSDMRR